MENIGSPSAPPPGSFYHPLLISLGGIVCASLAIAAYHLILVRYCSRRRADPPSWPLQGAREVGIGVEEHVLKAIPVMIFSPDACNNKALRVDQGECVICLGELEEGDKVRLLPNCGHVFHVCCIDDWFLAHTSCPICRAPIVPPATPAVHEPIANMIGGSQILPQFLEHEENEGGPGSRGGLVGDDSNASTSQIGCFRHGWSLLLHKEDETKKLPLMGLRRSVSMDHSFIVIDIQRTSEKPSSSCSSPTAKRIIAENKRYGLKPIMQTDRVSSKLFRSFSLMRTDNGVATDGIFPY